MQPISYNRVANLIRSTGTNIAVSSVSDYVRYAQEACMLFSLKRMVIVTNDEEGTVPLENGKQIEVIPAWKWLLE